MPFLINDRFKVMDSIGVADQETAEIFPLDDDDAGTFSTVLSVTLTYGYTETLSKEITITKIET